MAWPPIRSSNRQGPESRVQSPKPELCPPGTILAPQSWMLRRLITALAGSAGAAFLLVLVYPLSPGPDLSGYAAFVAQAFRPAEFSAVSGAPSNSRQTSDRIRIEHSVVQVPITPIQSAPVPEKRADASHVVGGNTRIALASNTSMPSRSGSRARAPEPPRTLLGRTMQRIVGNGRYTPQPFPRPK
jgi:hypothetical protein